jgi:hypothetical protein
MTIDAQQRAELDRRVRAATSSQRDALRARIILASEDGSIAEVVARKLGVHRRTVERWRSRFAREGLAGLEDRPRPGHKPAFGPVARLQVIALACEPAPMGTGKSTRSIEDVRQDAIGRGIVERMSWSTVQRILADADMHPHRVQGWVHSPDPQFREKVTEITDLYRHPPPGAVVLSIDEKTGMQAIERRFPDRPAAPGRVRRREFEYKRHGTQSLFCSFEVHTGHVVEQCGETRKAQDLEAFMDKVAARYPGGPVHVIWDNLNIHFDGADHRWTAFNARHGERFVFHYTPKHASWVNQVELFFSILQRQCLRDGSFASTEELRATVLRFIAYWNREKARPFRWTFTGYPLQAGIEIEQAA